MSDTKINELLREVNSWQMADDKTPNDELQLHAYEVLPSKLTIDEFADVATRRL